MTQFVDAVLLGISVRGKRVTECGKAVLHMPVDVNCAAACAASFCTLRCFTPIASPIALSHRCWRLRCPASSPFPAEAVARWCACWLGMAGPVAQECSWSFPTRYVVPGAI